jgi:hypothetical protein
MSFQVSFGSNSLKNGRTVSKTASMTAPSFLMDVTPGHYAITMTGIDVPYVHWIKVNMVRNGKRGEIVANYQGPLPDNPNVPQKRKYSITLWRQARQLNPAPPAPNNRSTFSLDAFVAKYEMAPVMSLVFSV